MSTVSPLLLGGSFNPPHCGHMRIAIECAEAFAPAPLLFIPCALPPHKTASELLPFTLRCAMLRAAIASLSDPALRERLQVSEVENERSDPSYTVDTLRIFADRHPGRRPFFILGSEDYDRLHTWREWDRLPELTNLVVLPRGETDTAAFEHRSRLLWPKASPLSAEQQANAGLPLACTAALALPDAGYLLYLPLTRMDLSSSMVRTFWAKDRNLDFLVPEAVRLLLAAHADEAGRTWHTKTITGGTTCHFL